VNAVNHKTMEEGVFISYMTDRVTDGDSEDIDCVMCKDVNQEESGWG